MYRTCLLAVIGTLLAATGSASAAEYTLDVFGSPGMKFRGNCLMLPASKPLDRRKFEDLAPEAYLFETPEISCAVQKWDSFGRLKVRLWRGRALVAEAETAASFGRVRLWWENGKAHSRGGPASSLGRLRPRPAAPMTSNP
jgi:hypothetical protein